MRVLAIETASEACSVALFEGTRCLARHHEVLGRGHAERLVPAIAGLPDKGRADEIRVSLGPGSFTGVRIGLAAARALGVAWSAPVLGYPTLALIGAMARSDSSTGVCVCVNGGHGQWFVQNFDWQGRPEDEVRSLAPEAAVLAVHHARIAGNRASELAALVTTNTEPVSILPDAGATHLLPSSSFTAELAPIYGRLPDAKPASRS